MLADLVDVGFLRKVVSPLIAIVSVGHPCALLGLDFVAFSIADG